MSWPSNEDERWRQVFDVDGVDGVDGRPVPDSASDARGAAHRASIGARAVGEVVDAFGRLAYTTNGDFEGDAAAAFAERAKAIQKQLEAAEPMLADLATVMRQHADDVESLRGKAAKSLHSAKTQWNRYQDAEQRARQAAERVDGAAKDHSDAVSLVQFWEDQLADVTPDDGGYHNAVVCLEDAEGDRDSAARRRMTAEGDLRSAGEEKTQARELLVWVRRGKHNLISWEALKKDVEELDGRTAAAIEALDLGALADPNAAVAFFSDAVNYVGDFVHDAYSILESAVTGDFDAAMHYLRDALAKVDFVLGAVQALIVVLQYAAIVGGTLLGALGTGGIGIAAGFGAGLLIAKKLELVSQKVSEVSKTVKKFRMATTVYLAQRGTPHPETGRVVTNRDVAEEAFWMGTDTIADRVPVLSETYDYLKFGAEAHKEFAPDAEWRHDEWRDLRNLDPVVPDPPSLSGRATSARGALESWTSQSSDEVSMLTDNTPRLIGVGS